MGGYLVTEGVADIQTVSNQTVTYRVGTDTTEFIVNGLQTTSTDELQARINIGATLPLLLPAPVPDDATIIQTEFSDLEFRTDYNAREVRVYVGTQVAVP